MAATNRRIVNALAIASWVVTVWTLGRVAIGHAGLYVFSQHGPRESVPWVAAWYVAGVLAIIAAHEGGHIWRASRYGMTTVGPFVVPVPMLAWVPVFGAIGTAGAFVCIRNLAKYTPVQRFDVAWSGVWWGAVMTAAVTALGVLWSHPAGAGAVPAQWWTPDAFAWLASGRDRWHPLLFAARVGWLITAVNLAPVWPADGYRMLDVVYQVWPVRRRHILAAGMMVLICWL